jgi:hypothetical protein
VETMSLAKTMAVVIRIITMATTENNVKICTVGTTVM